MAEEKRHMNVDKISLLARIELSDDEKEQFGEQLEKILSYIDQLQAVDVTEVEPMAHAFEVINIWRDDRVGSSFSQEEALANAPAKQEMQICVPRVIDDVS
ncbi:MAG: Asp-tRNA(Asn)/Glu-tRNA(Gln) amidotransferase subunit GatC [Puniceicoccales bacterium]|jgi:aspartyl-tRNA(Asn)/glutamyl-tRNA(Gln) amidotransferase subunit C|nr:Asp-tRNA(Asn)/Glu-tRNA(Gln) amidotransferase subunit GatC [Puniceicoccales bacterium]